MCKRCGMGPCAKGMKCVMELVKKKFFFEVI